MMSNGHPSDKEICETMERWDGLFKKWGWKNTRKGAPLIGNYTSWVHGDFEVHVFFQGSFNVHYHPDSLEAEAVARSSWSIETCLPDEVALFFGAMMDPVFLPLCVGLFYAEPK